MTPPIGSTIHLAAFVPASPRPHDVIIAAIRMAEARGIRVRFGEAAGVVRSDLGLGGDWTPVVSRVPRTINPVGAILLALQPERRHVEHESPDGEAAHVLHVHPMWLHGVIDGWSNDGHPEMLTAPARADYLRGVRAGHRIYLAIAVECPVCDDLRLAEDDACACTQVARPRRR